MLYRRLGFVEEGTILKYLQYGRVTLPPSSTDIYELHLADIPELVTFDTPSFGAERSKVFSSYLREPTVRGFVARNAAREITGYIFAEPGFLGPWVARTPEDAEHLLTRTLSLSLGSRLSTTIPAMNEAGQHLLKRYHFHQREKDYFMR